MANSDTTYNMTSENQAGGFAADKSGEQLHKRDDASHPAVSAIAHAASRQNGRPDLAKL